VIEPLFGEHEISGNKLLTVDFSSPGVWSISGEGKTLLLYVEKLDIKK